ncbi:MAG: hypothetical protein ACYDCK_07975 [Thermoplasmatota archaeon]
MLTLIVPCLLSAAVAALMGYTGVVTFQRRLAGEAGFASRIHAVWWLGVAAASAIGALAYAFAVLGILDSALHTTLLLLMLLSSVVALWALAYSLLYLYSGTRRFLAPTLALYAFCYAALLYAFEAMGPYTFVVDRWSITPVAARGALPALDLCVGALLAGPLVAAAIAYGYLAIRRLEGAQRVRAAAFSGGLTGAGVLTAALFALHVRSGSIEVLTDVLGVVAAFALALASRPRTVEAQRRALAADATRAAARPMERHG